MRGGVTHWGRRRRRLRLRGTGSTGARSTGWTPCTRGRWHATVRPWLKIHNWLINCENIVDIYDVQK